MNYKVIIRMPISINEVPELREHVGGIDEMKIIPHCLNAVISGLGLEMKIIS